MKPTPTPTQTALTEQITMNRRTFQRLVLGTGTGLALSSCAQPTATPTALKTVNAIDCHAHIFTRDLPMPDRRRAPSGYDAPLPDYLSQLDAHGMTHGVLVQPSFLGTDNHYLRAALQQYPQRLRGIAVVEPGIHPSELERMQEEGVVGVRLNLVGLPTPDYNSPLWTQFLARLRTLQWQVEVHQEARKLAQCIDPLLEAGLQVVVDHFGRPDAALGIDDPGFRHLLELGKSRQVWVKISGAYRNGAHGVGEATGRHAMPLLRESLGLDRLIWGSDWPHTLFESTTNYDQAVALLHDYLPDPNDRAQVLWNTPAALFKFNTGV